MIDSQLEEQYGSKPPSKKRTRVTTEDPFQTFEQFGTNTKVTTQSPSPTKTENKSSIFGQQALLGFLTYPSTVGFSSDNSNLLRVSGDDLTTPNFNNSNSLDVEQESHVMATSSASNNLNLDPFTFTNDIYSNYLQIEDDQCLFSLGSTEISEHSHFSNTVVSSTTTNNEIKSSEFLDTSSKPKNGQENTNLAFDPCRQNESTRNPTQTIESFSSPSSSTQNNNFLSSSLQPTNFTNDSTVSLSTPSLPSQNSSPLSTIQPVHPKTTNITNAILLEQRQKFQLAKECLETLRREQKELLSMNMTDFLQATQKITTLENLQQTLHHSFEEMYRVLNTLMAQFILDPIDINRVYTLQNELHIEMQQLIMYERELKMATQPNFVDIEQIPATLVITKQPFPRSVKQNKPMEDGVTVRLLTGAYYQISPTSPMRADVITDYTTRSKKNPTAVQNNIKPIHNFVAVFNDLIFPNGTRKKTIRLKFTAEIQVQLPNGSFFTKTLESNFSQPFIVKTNENQWEESEGILLKMETFGDALETSWCQFANTLQKRYLAATKQDIQKPTRPLSVQDINYLYQLKFATKSHALFPTTDTIITTEQFDKFWEWFGPGLQKIRYQRHLCPMWTKGLICGFINRSEADKVLANASVGTFMIRLSERCAGGFAIAYVAQNPTSDNPDNRVIRHYLIQPDDVFGAKKTLPDFLGQARNFHYLVQIYTDPDGNRIYRQVNKDTFLGEYYSKRSFDNPYGYDSQLEVGMGNLTINSQPSTPFSNTPSSKQQ